MGDKLITEEPQYGEADTSFLSLSAQLQTIKLPLT